MRQRNSSSSTISPLFAASVIFCVLAALALPGADGSNNNSDDDDHVADTHNASERAPADTTCRISIGLYKKYMGETGIMVKDRPRKECEAPGCFYVEEQDKFGWKFPNALRDPKASRLVLMGCRVDIPSLLARTEPNEHLHRTMMALRACYIGKRDENEAGAQLRPYCQPEHPRLAHRAQNDKLMSNETWAGRFLPSAQQRCFLKFRSGVFFVHDEEDGGERVVCCSDGTATTVEENSFREQCRQSSAFINKIGKWRKDIDL